MGHIKIDKETADKLLVDLKKRNSNRLYIRQQCKYLLPCGWCDKYDKICTQIGV